MRYGTWNVRSLYRADSFIAVDRELAGHKLDLVGVQELGNACYYSVQNLLSSSLLSKNLKIKIYRTIILPVVLYGCETWSLTMRDKRRLRVFENRVLRRVFGPKRDEVKRGMDKIT